MFVLFLDGGTTAQAAVRKCATEANNYEEILPYNGRDECGYFSGTDADGSSHKGLACVCSGNLCNTDAIPIGAFTGLTILSVLVMHYQNHEL